MSSLAVVVNTSLVVMFDTSAHVNDLRLIPLFFLRFSSLARFRSLACASNEFRSEIFLKIRGEMWGERYRSTSRIRKSQP